MWQCRCGSRAGGAGSDECACGVDGSQQLEDRPTQRHPAGYAATRGGGWASAPRSTSFAAVTTCTCTGKPPQCWSPTVRKEVLRVVELKGTVLAVMGGRRRRWKNHPSARKDTGAMPRMGYRRGHIQPRDTVSVAEGTAC
jgi:hypothetical protein